MLASVMNAVGSISQGRSDIEQANSQASMLEQQAARERQIAADEERDFRKKQSAVAAKYRAAMGASGTEIGTGTPLLAAMDFAAETELQAQRIREGGATRAGRMQQEAGLTRSAGRAAQRQGYMRAGSSLLTGAGQYYGPARTSPKSKTTVESIIT